MNNHHQAVLSRDLDDRPVDIAEPSADRTPATKPTEYAARSGTSASTYSNLEANALRPRERWLTDVLPARSQVQAKSTVTNHRWAAGHAIRGLGRRRLGELTPENVEALLRHLADEGMARNSVMRVRSVLVMALKHAQRRDIVARNVAELSEMPTSARDPRPGRALTPEEARCDSTSACSVTSVVTQANVGGTSISSSPPVSARR